MTQITKYRRPGRLLDRTGVTTVEYSLIAVGIAVTIAASIPPVAGAVMAIFDLLVGDIF